MANPDDRSDNVEKLKKMKENTAQNIEAAEESIAKTDMSSEQKQAVREKNKRRENSIQAFDAEMADEMNERNTGYKGKE